MKYIESYKNKRIFKEAYNWDGIYEIFSNAVKDDSFLYSKITVDESGYIQFFTKDGIEVLISIGRKSVNVKSPGIDMTIDFADINKIQVFSRTVFIRTKETAISFTL